MIASGLRIGVLVAGGLIGVPGNGLPPDLKSPFVALREAARHELLVAEDSGRAAALLGLGDPDYRTRRLCLEALEDLATSEDLPRLAALFSDRDEGVRVTAVTAFAAASHRQGRVGPEAALAAGARPADVDLALHRIVRGELLALFDLPNPSRWTYDRRFASIVSLGPLASGALRAAAQDRRLSPVVRAAALVSLARLGDPAEAAFFTQFGRSDLDRRPSAFDPEDQLDEPLAASAAALALLGTNDAAGISFLEEVALRNASAYARTWALWALVLAADGASADARERIRGATLGALRTDRDGGVLSMAAQSLAWLDVREAVPDLLRAAEQEVGGYVAWFFLDAAWQLSEPEAGDSAGVADGQGARASVLAALERVATSGKPPAVAFARVRLGRAGEERETLVKRLYRLIDGAESTEEDDSYAFGPRTACFALALLEERGAIEKILGMCASPMDDIRSGAFEALRRFADPGTLPVVLPALRKGLEDPSEFNRLRAAQSLLALGDAAAIPALVEGLDSGNVFVRTMSVSLLAPIRRGAVDGYDARGSVSARREPVARWRAWWREKGGAVKWNAAAGAFEEP